MSEPRFIGFLTRHGDVNEEWTGIYECPRCFCLVAGPNRNAHDQLCPPAPTVSAEAAAADMQRAER